VIGLECTSIRRVHLVISGGPPSHFGPLELGWEDGTFRTLDVNPDWTLDVADHRWTDPYASASVSERAHLQAEIGVWSPGIVDDELHAVEGRRLTAFHPQCNEVNEVIGVFLEFGEVVLDAHMFAGNLSVSVRP
jgi:hypothetical protein